MGYLYIYYTSHGSRKPKNVLPWSMYQASTMHQALTSYSSGSSCTGLKRNVVRAHSLLNSHAARLTSQILGKLLKSWKSEKLLKVSTSLLSISSQKTSQRQANELPYALYCSQLHWQSSNNYIHSWVLIFIANTLLIVYTAAQTSSQPLSAWLVTSTCVAKPRGRWRGSNKLCSRLNFYWPTRSRWDNLFQFYSWF